MLLLIPVGIVFYFIFAFNPKFEGNDPANKSAYLAAAVYSASACVLTFLLTLLIDSTTLLNIIAVLLLGVAYVLSLGMFNRNARRGPSLPLFVDLALGLGLLYLIIELVFETLFWHRFSHGIADMLPLLLAAGVQGLLFLKKRKAWQENSRR
jgi:hypothetical protein